jgi:hypothetical protein
MSHYGKKQCDVNKDVDFDGDGMCGREKCGLHQ